MINKTLEEYYKKYEITERDLIIFSRRCNETLESIASDYNLTRERIRQIEEKTSVKIKKIYEALNIQEYFKGKYYFLDTKSELDPMNYRVFYKDLEINNPRFIKKIYDKESVKIDKDVNEKIKEEMEKLFIEVTEKGNANSSDYQFMGVEQRVIDFYLKEKKLNKIGIKYFDNKRKSSIIKSYLDDTKKIINLLSPEKEIEEINSLYETDFKKGRAFEGIVLRVGLLCGKNEYCSTLLIPELKFLDKFKDELEKHNLVNCNDFYIQNMDLMEGIVSCHHLYGIIRFKFPNEYDYGGVNGIVSKKGERTSLQKIVEDYITNKKAPVTRKEIMKKYNIRSNIVSVVISQSKVLISWGKTSISRSDFHYRDEKIINYVTEYLKTLDMFKAQRIYSYLKSLDCDLEKNFIFTPEQLMTYLKRNDCLNDFNYDFIPRIYFKKK